MLIEQVFANLALGEIFEYFRPHIQTTLSQLLLQKAVMGKRLSQ